MIASTLPYLTRPEFFQATAVDWWVCPCGNQPDQDGHRNARSDGTPDDEDPTWIRHQTVTCMRCGRFGRYVDRDAQRKTVAVLGRIRSEILQAAVDGACELPPDTAALAVGEIDRVVAGFQGKLKAQMLRLGHLTPTSQVLDARSECAQLREMLRHRGGALADQLLFIAAVLERLNRVT